MSNSTHPPIPNFCLTTSIFLVLKYAAAWDANLQNSCHMNSCHLQRVDVCDHSECQCVQLGKGQFKSNPLALSEGKLRSITDEAIIQQRPCISHVSYLACWYASDPLYSCTTCLRVCFFTYCAVSVGFLSAQRQRKQILRKGFLFQDGQTCNGCRMYRENSMKLQNKQSKRAGNNALRGGFTCSSENRNKSQWAQKTQEFHRRPEFATWCC